MSMPKNSLSWAHPVISEWFIKKFGEATEPQQAGWPAILHGRSTLISAPTGSGKTLAAFLVCINDLFVQAINKKLKNETEVLYVSPLKALGNDIHKNLLEPLKEISALAKEKGIVLDEIRVAVRTGDTKASERQSMLKKPPHILVTTPESLYILLTAEKSRIMLSTVNTIIVDEIHAMLNDKRGTHLALSLERLDALTKNPAVRIGLSATQKPIEKVAEFLNGKNNKQTEIINIGHTRPNDIRIEVPKIELGAVASNEMWDEIYDRLAELSAEHRSILIFVNTRRLAERTAHHLRERLGEQSVAAHHGSLSKKIRLAVEHQLKNGELKILVATASLELGIDIGSIDLVCQIGSPRSIAVALQRIGRAGHWHGAISKGRIFATTRDELMECAALVYAIRQKDLDSLIIPFMPLDILSQQIVAICATGDWQENELYKLIKKSYPYQQLPRELFDAIIEMLSEGIASNRGRHMAYLFRDKVNHVVKARRGSRTTAIINGGAIPVTGLFSVVTVEEGLTIGTLDEDFAVESNRGDIILLGNTSWRIKRVEASASRVLVENAHGAPPSVPFWRGEAPARTNELSLQVSQLRERLNELLNEKNKNSIHHTMKWLCDETGVNESGARQLIQYVQQGRAILGTVPTQHRIIAERFFDESGGMQLVIHSPFGARINKAWGLALRKKFCRSFNFELQASATDDGLTISLTEQHSFPLSDVFRYLNVNTLESVLVQAVLQSPLFNTRWRWVATRALALLRFRHGRKIPPNIQRMLGDDLLAAVFPDAAACQDNLAGREIDLPDHPLIIETMKDILHEALDITGLKKIISEIASGQIQCLAIDTTQASPFAHEIVNANPYAFLDDAPLEERRARAVELRHLLPTNLSSEIGQLDKQVIMDVREQISPDIRNADELHDFLQTVIGLPLSNKILLDNNVLQEYFDELQHSGRATIANVSGYEFWVSAEKIKSFLLIHPETRFANKLKEIDESVADRETVLLNMVKGWMFYLGPVTVRELSDLLLVSEQDVSAVLIRLESTGLLIRGHFEHNNTDILEWCERRLLSRIHRYTLDRLRKEIEPVNAAAYMNWLLKWHYLTNENRAHGERGLLDIINKLQGFEIPAKVWEKQIFAKRMIDYSPELLDKLCLSGMVGWGRLSTPPNKRIMVTSTIPITFFVRENADWIPEHHDNDDIENQLSDLANKIYILLKQNGASFFSDIVQATGALKTQVENGLWELVAAGLITADGFDNLRSLIDVRLRLNKRRRLLQLRYSTGRWSLLKKPHKVDQQKQLESTCFMLLQRYGVVFRDLLAKEKNIPSWRELLPVFRRLEDRGEIRGGRFINGFSGEQFALAHIISSLRKEKQIIHEEMITLSSMDPLNLSGILFPGKRIKASTRESMSLKNGMPVSQ